MADDFGPEQLRADYQQMAHALLLRLAHLPEEPMRTARFVHEVERMGPLRAVWTVEWMIRGVLGKVPPAVEVYEGMADPRAVVAALGERRVEAMVQAGFEEGCVAAQQWLSSPRLAQAEVDEAEESRFVHFQLREITLGDRRALARRARGDDIKRLLVDPDPGVISNLLNNSRTTLQDVLVLCSQRPTLSPPLEAVMHARRWFRQYRIKRALVRNPHLTQRCSVNLLAFLTVSDLIRVRADGTLTPTLRRAAERLIELLP